MTEAPEFWKKTQKLLEIEAYEAMNKRRVMNIRGIITVLPSELVPFDGVALDPAPAFIHEGE